MERRWPTCGRPFIAPRLQEGRQSRRSLTKKTSTFGKPAANSSRGPRRKTEKFHTRVGTGHTGLPVFRRDGPRVRLTAGFALPDIRPVGQNRTEFMAASCAWKLY